MSTAQIDGKTCTKCGVWKGFGEFAPRKDSRDGRVGQCRPCRNGSINATANRARAKAWKQANRDRFREVNRPGKRSRNARYRKRNPDVAKRHAKTKNARLTDAVVANRLHLRVSDCDRELIELKREQLQLHRLLRDFKKVLEDEGESA